MRVLAIPHSTQRFPPARVLVHGINYRTPLAAPEAALRAVTRFYLHCAEHADIPELVTLATTISTWQNEILAYHHTTGASNGPTEAVNLLIEKTRRIGHGFWNFDNCRLRLLLACGIQWHTAPFARLRGRQPRAAA